MLNQHGGQNSHDCTATTAATPYIRCLKCKTRTASNAVGAGHYEKTAVPPSKFAAARNSALASCNPRPLPQPGDAPTRQRQRRSIPFWRHHCPATDRLLPSEEPDRPAGANGSKTPANRAPFNLPSRRIPCRRTAGSPTLLPGNRDCYPNSLYPGHKSFRDFRAAVPRRCRCH